MPHIALDMFGRDHWTTFAYLETRCVDHGGVPERAAMRCDPDRHPGLALESHAGRKYPTRLRGAIEQADHDDWDCADDIEAAGLITNVGTGIYPRFRMTPNGARIAAMLRNHKAAGGSLATFAPKLATLSEQGGSV